MFLTAATASTACRRSSLTARRRQATATAAMRQMEIDDEGLDSADRKLLGHGLRKIEQKAIAPTHRIAALGRRKRERQHRSAQPEENQQRGGGKRRQERGGPWHRSSLPDGAARRFDELLARFGVGRRLLQDRVEAPQHLLEYRH